MKGIYQLLHNFARQQLRPELAVRLNAMEQNGRCGTIFLKRGLANCIYININCDLNDRVTAFFHQLLHTDVDLKHRFFAISSENDSGGLNKSEALRKEYQEFLAREEMYELYIELEAQRIYVERPRIVEYVVKKYGLDRGLANAHKL